MDEMNMNNTWSFDKKSFGLGVLTGGTALAVIGATVRGIKALKGAKDQVDEFAEEFEELDER